MGKKRFLWNTVKAEHKSQPIITAITSHFTGQVGGTYMANVVIIGCAVSFNITSCLTLNDKGAIKHAKSNNEQQGRTFAMNLHTTVVLDIA